MFCFFQADEINVGIAGHVFPFLFGFYVPFLFFFLLPFGFFPLLYYSFSKDFIYFSYSNFYFFSFYWFLLYVFHSILLFLFIFILLVYIPLLRDRDQILDFFQILNFHFFYSRQMLVMPNDLFPKGLTKLASWKL